MLTWTLGSGLLLEARFGSCHVGRFVSCLLLMESEVGGKKIDRGIGNQRTDLLLCSASAQNREMQDSSS